MAEEKMINPKIRPINKGTAATAEIEHLSVIGMQQEIVF